MRMFCRGLAVSLLVGLASCSDSVPASPAGPSSNRTASLPSSHLVTGTLFETVDGRSRPLAGRQVHLYISGTCGVAVPGDCRPEMGRQPVITDHNGRYTAEDVPSSWVFASANVGQRQSCVAGAAVNTDTTIDVEVVPAGTSATPPPNANPMITGVVFETTPQGRKALRGVDVWLEVGYEGYFIASNQTDDAGRFFLCRVNAPAQMINAPLLMYVSSSGYQRPTPEAIPGYGDMFFEIELKR